MNGSSADYTTGGHTAQMVPLFASGPGAEAFARDDRQLSRRTVAAGDRAAAAESRAEAALRAWSHSGMGHRAGPEPFAAPCPRPSAPRPAAFRGFCSSAARLSWRQRRGHRRWFKGNTHAHSLNSDGDVPVDEVVRWYREPRLPLHVHHRTRVLHRRRAAERIVRGREPVPGDRGAGGDATRGRREPHRRRAPGPRECVRHEPAGHDRSASGTSPAG